jgi:rhamnulokinase
MGHTMADKAYLAFDLGAESGRAMLGVLADGKLHLHELHRFANRMHHLPDGYHWNTLGLWGNLVEGLARAGQYCRDHSLELVSLGVDTWGVDFGLIGASGGLLGIPFAYRDERNNLAMKSAIQTIGAEKLYAMTGIQFLPLNTLFQLVAIRDSEPALLDQARRLLWTPDLLHYFFTGEASNESSIASTSQMIDPRTGGWALEAMKALNLPTGFLGQTVPAGSLVGTLRPQVACDANVDRSLRVIAPAGHDTASAVAAVPTSGKDNWCYLSSGTWSLMGVELDQPVLTEAARAANFTNEGGVNRTIRFLTNIMGLWLVQELRRAFEKAGDTYDYQTLTRLAEDAKPLATLVDPAHGPFMQPGDMPAKIADFAKATGQNVPQGPGEMVRCCLESLALTYRRTLEGLERVLDRKLDVIHIVGGGAKNTLLNQMTADATGRPVTAGPFEATAAGNLLVQAMGAGDLADLPAIRQVIRDSFDPIHYQPADTARWDDACEQYQQILGRQD